MRNSHFVGGRLWIICANRWCWDWEHNDGGLWDTHLYGYDTTQMTRARDIGLTEWCTHMLCHLPLNLWTLWVGWWREGLLRDTENPTHRGLTSTRTNCTVVRICSVWIKKTRTKINMRCLWKVLNNIRFFLIHILIHTENVMTVKPLSVNLFGHFNLDGTWLLCRLLFKFTVKVHLCTSLVGLKGGR